MNTLQQCLLPIACLLIGIIVGAALLIILGLRPLGGSGGTPKEPPGPGNASTSSLPQAEKHQAELGRDAWKIPGKQWRLLVKKYSDASNVESAAPIPGEVAGGKPEVQAEFTMIVQTRPLRHRGDHDIARFQFVPSDKTPKHLIGQKFVLDIDVQTEQAVELHPSDPISFPVRTFGEDRYLRTQSVFAN